MTSRIGPTAPSSAAGKTPAHAIGSVLAAGAVWVALNAASAPAYARLLADSGNLPLVVLAIALPFGGMYMPGPLAFAWALVWPNLGSLWWKSSHADWRMRTGLRGVAITAILWGLSSLVVAAAILAPATSASWTSWVVGCLRIVAWPTAGVAIVGIAGNAVSTWLHRLLSTPGLKRSASGAPGNSAGYLDEPNDQGSSLEA